MVELFKDNRFLFENVCNSVLFRIAFWENECADKLFQILWGDDDVYFSLSKSSYFYFLLHGLWFNALSATSLQLHVDRGGHLSHLHLTTVIDQIAHESIEEALAKLQVFVNARRFDIRLYDFVCVQAPKEVIHFACKNGATPSAGAIFAALRLSLPIEYIEVLIRAGCAVTNETRIAAQEYQAQEEILRLLSSSIHIWQANHVF